MIFVSLISMAVQPAALPDPLDAGWEGERVCVLKHEDETLRMLECTFPPGVGHERHTHAPQVGYVIEGGRQRITDDEGTREIDVPSGITWSRDEPYTHIAVNVGDTTTRYIIVEPKVRQEIEPEVRKEAAPKVRQDTTAEVREERVEVRKRIIREGERAASAPVVVGGTYPDLAALVDAAVTGGETVEVRADASVDGALHIEITEGGFPDSDRRLRTIIHTTEGPDGLTVKTITREHACGADADWQPEPCT